MKPLLASLLALSVAACSSTGPKPQDAAATPQKAAGASALIDSSFPDSGGTLNLVFDAQGNWVRITSKGTASLTDESPSGRETALAIATMLAKRSVAEFMNNDIRSAKTVSRIARSYARTLHSSGDQPPDDDIGDTAPDFTYAGTETSRQANRVATTLTERIRDNSSAILKGVYVSQRSFEDGRVIVEVTASRESVQAAHQAHRMMRGSMQ